MSNLDFIYNRHSVRKFKEDDVPLTDIKEIIKAANQAPSGKNLQNWHFVVIKDQEKIEKVAEIIENKNAQLVETIEAEDKKEKFTKFLRFATHFKNAPVTILVYTSEYPITGLHVLKEAGASSDKIHKLLRTAPGIQNVGAAMENLMLAAAEMGYGTCWMTSQNYANQEIEDFIGLEKEGYFLAAITPLGIPEGDIKSPPRKSVEEVMTIIE